MDLSYVFDYGLAHRREAGVVVHFIYGHGASLEKQVGTQLQTVHIFVDAEVTADLHSHAPAFQIFGDRAVQMQFRHPVSVQFRACKRAEHLQTEIVVDVAGVQFEDQVPVAVYISGIEGNQTGTVHGGAVDVVSQPRAGKHGGHAAVHRRNAYGDYLTFIFGDAELRIRAQRSPVSGTGFEKIGEAGTFRVWQSVAYAQGKTEVQTFRAAVAQEETVPALLQLKSCRSDSPVRPALSLHGSSGSVPIRDHTVLSRGAEGVVNRNHAGAAEIVHILLVAVQSRICNKAVVARRQG